MFTTVALWHERWKDPWHSLRLDTSTSEWRIISGRAKLKRSRRKIILKNKGDTFSAYTYQEMQKVQRKSKENPTIVNLITHTELTSTTFYPFPNHSTSGNFSKPVIMSCQYQPWNDKVCKVFATLTSVLIIVKIGYCLPGYRLIHVVKKERSAFSRLVWFKPLQFETIITQSFNSTT